jgi:hypothetical protein
VPLVVHSGKTYFPLWAFSDEIRLFIRCVLSSGRPMKKDILLQLTLSASFILIQIALSPSQGISARAGAEETDESAAVSAVDNVTPPTWTYTLPSATCPGSSSDKNCSYSSPVLADLTGDGKLEIIVGTNNGYIVVVRHNGTLLWQRDVAPFFGMAAGTQQITSSPAVGDIDNNGNLDIVVGAGSTLPNVCTHGGVIALDRFGNVKSGWPQLAVDQNQNGCRDTVFSTPALGDISRDGTLEVVAGGFDKRLYAWRHNGQLLPGFPVDSHHAKRFPTWGLNGRLTDTIWSSPALADLNGDGHLDIIIGTDEGNFDARYGGDSGGWSCPYALPPGWAPGYCGGALYAVDRLGRLLPGFPRYFLEIIQSTPIVADVTGDGRPEIFVGTGTFYHDNSPDRPTYGFRMIGLDSNGNDLPGWAGGKVVGSTLPASPSLGDITGNGQPEVVVAGMDGKLYAWQTGGQTVAGFPMTPRTQIGTTTSFNVGAGFVMADYTGDGRMEIIFNQAWTVTVVNGSGQQLTTTNFPSDPRPLYFAEGTLMNTPAVGDLNGNGKLELIAVNSKIFVWELPDSGDEADWPLYKRNATRTSNVPLPARLEVAPGHLLIMHQPGQGNTAQATLLVRNTGGQPLHWSMSTPAGVTVAPASGSVPAGGSQSVTVSVNASTYPNGTHTLGAVITNAHCETHGPAQNSPAATNVSLYVGPVTKVFLPYAQR